MKYFARMLCWGSAAMLAWTCAPAALGKEPVQEFLEGLRQRKYFDTAEEYLETLRNNPNIEAEIKALIPYEQGRILIDSSKTNRDIAARLTALDGARDRFKEFLDKNPQHAMAGEARLQLGQVLVERGKTALELSKKPGDAARKKELLHQARKHFDEAISTFATAAKEYEAKWKAFPTFTDKTEQKEREAKAQALSDFISAQLHHGEAIYESAQAYDAGSKERTDTLKKAADYYHELYSKFRTRLAGLFAGMLEGRCYQDLGDLKRALGLYEELLAQPNEPDAFRLLRSKVLRLAVEAWTHKDQAKYEEVIKRGEEWLKAARPNEEDAPEGLAISYFTALAGHLLIERDKDKTDLPPEAQNLVKRMKLQVPVYAKTAAERSGEFQDKARELLSKYRSIDGEPQTFAQALEMGQGALEDANAKEYEIKDAQTRSDRKAVEELTAARDALLKTALKNLRLAIQLRDTDTPVDDVNLARYLLAFLYYNIGYHHDAAVMGEFLSRHYPQAAGAKHGAKIAMAGYRMAYNNASSDDRAWETQQMVRVATFITEKWPHDQEADEAWMILGDIAIREKDLDQAAEYLSRIPADSPRRSEADIKAGQALWSSYLSSQRLETKLPQEVTDKMLQEAQAKLVAGIEAVRKSGKPIDYNLLAAELSLAQLYVNTDRGAEAVAILETKDGPLDSLAKGLEVLNPYPAFAREAYKAALRAYVAVQNLDRAEAMMNALEELTKDQPDSERVLTQIYISLGRDLEEQVKSPQIQGDPAKLQKLLQGFELFLKKIATKTEGNTFGSLYWVAETFYRLGSSIDTPGKSSPKAKEYYAEAAKTYEALLTRSELKPESRTGLEVRLSKCKRRMGKHLDAINMLLKILGQNERIIEAQVEAAYTFQEWSDATKDPKYYKYAIAGYITNVDVKNAAGKVQKVPKQLVWGWATLANRVASNQAYSDTFHEARVNLAECRLKQAMTQSGDEKFATLKKGMQDIRATHKFYPQLGGEVWRSKYDRVLRSIEQALGQTPGGIKALDKAETQPTTAKAGA
jgi:hypothetical protein